MLNREKSALYGDLERILLGRDEIAARVEELGAEITRDYAGKTPVCIGILKGATPFYCDLIRCIDLKLTMDFMATSSYGSATKSSGVVRLLKDLDHDVLGRDVIIIEDIVDSGVTLNYLKDNLKGRGANSIKICTLLDKPARRRVALPARVGAGHHGEVGHAVQPLRPPSAQGLDARARLLEAAVTVRNVRHPSV